MTAATAPARTVHVEHCMGTVFTIDVRDPGEWGAAIGEVVAWLHDIDRVFSTYRPDSDVSRLRRGEIALDDCDERVADALGLCAEVQAETRGYFSALSGGRVDPTGLVKGWAVERASGILRRHGSADHAVNGGGDLQLAGEAEPGRAWRVGIVEPGGRDVVASVAASDGIRAVATSGVAERGRHIVDPFTGRAVAHGPRSASVVGPSLTRADCYATAAFVMGAGLAAEWMATVPGYELLLVDDDGTLQASAGWPRED